MEALLAVEREVDKALDSFGGFYESLDEDIEKAIELVTENISNLAKCEDEANLKTVAGTSIQQCKEQLKEFIKRYSDKHKDLHGSISKIGKVIDKNFIADYGNLPQTNIVDTEEKQGLLDEVIYEHLLRHGRIDVADELVKEASLSEAECDSKKRPFVEMSYILKQIREKDVQPALDWCLRNREKLAEMNSNIEFNLHRLNFIKFIQEKPKKQTDAILYARNFTPFARTCQKEIQRLMGSLLYANTGLENSPYSSLLSQELWTEIEEEFIKNVCKLMGLSVECPLNVCVHAGCKALPALINIVQVMQQTQVGHILSKDELPIEIDIGSNYRYHSVFACPILRQQSTDLNPPMKLICGHVISKDALGKLNTSGKSSRLKCPYCPIEQAPGDARQMFF